MLSRAQADVVWRLFQKSPLFVRWHGVQAQIPSMLDALEITPGQAIYRTGEAPGCLYLVGAGIVHQKVSRDGQAWLQQEFRPGQFFGQQALFTNDYLAQATSDEGATLSTSFTASHMQDITASNVVFYDDKAAGASLVRFTFCKQRAVLEDAVARLTDLGQ